MGRGEDATKVGMGRMDSVQVGLDLRRVRKLEEGRVDNETGRRTTGKKNLMGGRLGLTTDDLRGQF